MKTMEQLLRLRLIVGFLGEKNQFAWWHTTFFGATGRAALAYTFPRSTLLAQFTGASEAARLLHDEHIGVGRVFHLFRLPEEVEQDIHRILQDGNLVIENDVLLRQDAAEAELEDSVIKICRCCTLGPVTLGDSATLASQDAIQKMAALYLSAFQAGTRVYPYFRATA
jgi:hypothetical protein